MKRIEAIRDIMKFVEADDIVVASLGFISRDVYAVRDRDLNFYAVSAMGISLSIAIGMAINCQRDVLCITGDGDSLMGLNSFALHNSLRPQNLWHIIIDNGEHASTGGQPTCSSAINFEKLAPNTVVYKVDKGKGDSPRIPLTCEQIKERFVNAISNNISL